MTGSQRFLINNVLVSTVTNRIELVVQAGRFDALVSSEDTELSMRGGVSAAIREAAGEEIVREARALTPLRVGEVAVTSAGRLPARHILHAVTVDWKNRVLPSELTIRLAAQTVFRHCEARGVKKLAMPALGTSAGGFSADHSARLIVNALFEHAENPTVIQEVVFCLPRARDWAAFEEYLRTLVLREPDGSDGSTGPVERAAVGVGSWLRGLRVGQPKSIPPPPRSVETTHSLSARDPAAPEESRSWHPWQTNSRPVVGNRYVLLEELGRGGMGIVFLAWDAVLRQTLAIKTLRPDRRQSSMPETLRREAALQIGLMHESIVRLLHFEPWDSTVGPYILMEYVPWASGERWIAEAGTSGLPVATVLAVGMRLCDALRYAHAAGVIHGDIKPSNIFVDPSGEAAKLADFGIARAIGPGNRHALVTKLAGTPDYMAPEQKKLGAKVSPRSDIYMLAKTLSEFLRGRMEADRLVLPDDSRLQPVGSVLRHALAREPTDRPADANEFGRLLSSAQTEVV